MPSRRGRKSAAQTPAPKSERIYGSTKNRAGSAKSEKSASKIKFDAKTIVALKGKLKEFKSEHPNKNITLADLKAVYRRGAGAYSSSHRPTITGGAPNSRNAWSMARVNKFLKKAAGEKVKAAYVQDDDLMENGGETTKSELRIIIKNIKDASKKYQGSYKRIFDIIEENIVYYNPYGTTEENLIKNDFHITITPRPDNNAIEKIKKLKDVIVLDDDLMENGGDVDNLIKDGIVELRMYDTTNEHSKIYGFDAKRPLYIQTIIVSKENRGKGIGRKVIEYIIDYANKNGNDIIFGHITQQAEPSIEVLKSILAKSGFNICEGNNDFYKVMYDDDLMENGELIKTDFNDYENSDFRKAIISLWNDFTKGIIASYLSVGEDNYVLSDEDSVMVIFRDKKYGDFTKVEKAYIENWIKSYLDNDKKPDIAKYIQSYQINDNKIIIRLNPKENYKEGGIPEDKFVMAASKFQAKYLEQGGNSDMDKIYYYEISNGKFIKGKANFYLNEFTQSDETYDDRLPRTIYLDKSKLFEQKPQLNPYQIQSRLKEKIEEFLGVGIKTLDGIAEGIKQDEGGGQIKFSFQEATKYGRDDFNKSSIQRLNDKSFKYEEYQIRISNVKFNGEESYQYDEKNGYKTYFFTAEFLFEQSMSKGGMTDEEKKETYKKWRKLVNMSRTQLETFYNSEEGKKAGLSASEAASQGIDSGRESARWIMKMKSTPVKDWTPTMWKWAKKQISFISRMSGNKGGLYDEKGNKTRKHLSLLIWGHNPKKHEQGGEVMALKTVTAEQAENRLQRIADKFGVSVKFLRQQLELGIETEMEHTTDKDIARKIALDHLAESPIYYQVLSQIEGYMTDQKMIDDYYASIYAKGGATKVEYSFTTPTGNPTKLNYIQQILVRTTAFKNWFGDWEKAAKDYINDPEKDWSKHYATVSKVIDPYTLEPLVVYHGSNAEKEFYEFDATAIGQKGRPYAYFADNRDYSLNFTRFSQRGTQGIPLIYNCFLNIRKPFFAIGNEFDQKVEDKDYWLKQIVLRVFTDKKEDPKDSGLMKQYIASVKSQIGEHLAAMPPNFQFWIFMAKDLDKIFKTFLITNGYDGIRYSEELKPNYDPNNPAEFTNAWTIFDAGQIKLADGRNLDFNPMSKDIRLDEGGDTSVTNNVPMSKGEALRANLGIEAAEMDAGGYLVGKQKGRTVKHNDASKGGVFHGKSHAEGGIQGINRATGQPIEVEGYEMQIITEAVSDGSEKDFEGRKMTNREILSYLNVQSGGKSFDSGGVTMPEHYDTGGEVGEPIEYKGGEVILTKKAFSNPKKYNYKGRMMTSRQIASDINSEAGGLSFGEGGTTCGCSYGLGGMTDSYAVDALNYINDLTKRIYGT